MVKTSILLYTLIEHIVTLNYTYLRQLVQEGVAAKK